MGPNPTLVRVLLCPRVGPLPFPGLTTRWDNLGIYLTLQLTLYKYLYHFPIKGISCHIISFLSHNFCFCFCFILSESLCSTVPGVEQIGPDCRGRLCKPDDLVGSVVECGLIYGELLIPLCPSSSSLLGLASFGISPLTDWFTGKGGV